MSYIVLQSRQPFDSALGPILERIGTGNLSRRSDHLYYFISDAPLEGPRVEELKSFCHEHQVDVSVTPERPRPFADYKVLAMDMDSTLINIECIDEIADLCGKKTEVAAITESAMRGELDFLQSLRNRVSLLQGIPVAHLQQVYDYRLCLNPGAEELLAEARAAGMVTLLMSGGFTFFTDQLKKRLQIDHTRSNVLEVSDGILTGSVSGPIVDAMEKRRTVEALCAELGCATTDAIVMGDGANDLEAMSVAGLSVAYHAKPAVRAQADLALNFVGLDGVLKALG